ncbi:MAG: hypothetical protein GDA48_27640 [Hormoscilla sp. GM102CHS1]|nr:hypothetical protein [Hormoscilla sp. GM102CHS1]
MKLPWDIEVPGDTALVGDLISLALAHDSIATNTRLSEFGVLCSEIASFLATLRGYFFPIFLRIVASLQTSVDRTTFGVWPLIGNQWERVESNTILEK